MGAARDITALNTRDELERRTVRHGGGARRQSASVRRLAWPEAGSTPARTRRRKSAAELGAATAGGGGEAVKVGIKFDQPGMGLKEGTTYTGFDVDVANYIAKELNYTPSFVEAVSAQRETLLETGQVSTSSAPTRSPTPARRRSPSPARTSSPARTC